MNYYGYEFIRESDLAHHGIKGQKWGQRRFQNEDGTWTAAGKVRYGDMEGSTKGAAHRALSKVYGINEKFYAKRGNTAMAEANRNARNAQLQKAAAADQMKRENGPSKLDKVADRALTRANIRVEKMGGRKMNATTQQKLDRGERLVRKDRTVVGAVGRTVGRQMVIKGAGITAGMALAGVSMIAARKNPAVSAGILKVGGKALQAAMITTTAASLIRGYQDVHDIHAYNKSKKGSKKK